jgi:replicative DNA helicase
MNWTAEIPDVLESSRSPELDAEQSVLGGILIDPSRLDDAVDILSAEDFFRAAHRRIWEAIRQVASSGGAIDLLTVRAALGPHLDDVGGPAYLAGLTDGVPRATNVAHYARLVRDYALRRAVERLGRELVSAAVSGADSGADLLERGETTLLALRTSQPGTSVSDPAARAAAAMTTIEAAAEGKRRGVLSGLRELDAMTFGFRPGQLIVLGARPSQGKTALALNIARGAGVSGPVLFASLEMSTEQINLRELALRAAIPHALLDAGRIPAHLHGTLADALQAVYDGNIHVLDRPGATVSQIRGAARRLTASAKRPPALIVVDYLQLMRSERGTRVENRTLEVAQFSAGLKQIARELDVPVLALSQLSRQSETRQDKRPILADLRESGALEQDADIVLLLHRSGVYDRNPDDRRAEVIVAKQRNGPTGIAHLQFDAETMGFSDASALEARA